MASSTVGSGVGQTILEYFLKLILTKYLKIPDGWLLKTIINFSSKKCHTNNGI